MAITAQQSVMTRSRQTLTAPILDRRSSSETAVIPPIGSAGLGYDRNATAPPHFGHRICHHAIGLAQ